LLLIGAAYFIFLEWRFGMTAGKKLFGLRVVPYGGAAEKLSFPSAFWRWTGFLAAGAWAYSGYWAVSGLLGLVKFAMKPGTAFLATLGAISIVAVCSLGLLITFIGKHRRGFHDLLARSIVVDATSMERGEKGDGKN
jgi:uncharacterized RDD family membrane protein YckC